MQKENSPRIKKHRRQGAKARNRIFPARREEEGIIIKNSSKDYWFQGLKRGILDRMKPNLGLILGLCFWLAIFSLEVSSSMAADPFSLSQDLRSYVSGPMAEQGLISPDRAKGYDQKYSQAFFFPWHLKETQSGKELAAARFQRYLKNPGFGEKQRLHSAEWVERLAGRANLAREGKIHIKRWNSLLDPDSDRGAHYALHRKLPRQSGDLSQYLGSSHQGPPGQGREENHRTVDRLDPVPGDGS
jgi:hypothetical protein